MLGVNAVNSMRANQLFCALTESDPATTVTPVVGGTGRCTRVPVFSAARDSANMGLCNIPQVRNFLATSIDIYTQPGEMRK